MCPEDRLCCCVCISENFSQKPPEHDAEMLSLAPRYVGGKTDFSLTSNLLNWESTPKAARERFQWPLPRAAPQRGSRLADPSLQFYHGLPMMVERAPLGPSSLDPSATRPTTQGRPDGLWHANPRHPHTCHTGLSWGLGSCGVRKGFTPSEACGVWALGLAWILLNTEWLHWSYVRFIH